MTDTSQNAPRFHQHEIGSVLSVEVVVLCPRVERSVSGVDPVPVVAAQGFPHVSRVHGSHSDDGEDGEVAADVLQSLLHSRQVSLHCVFVRFTQICFEIVTQVKHLHQ